MDRIFDTATHIFDPLHTFWSRDKTERNVAGLLVIIFLLSLAAIELNRQGLLPGSLAQRLPTNHYMAISIAFTLVLILEVIGLIFTLPCSISRALGKQFEILALIFLRNSFKELVSLPEPITITGENIEVLWRILSDGGGAVVIFAFLGLYTYLLKKGDDGHSRYGISLYRFVAAKKLVALIMLVVFLAMGFYNAILILQGASPFGFFHHFYTVLIFSDVLLVLISQCFLPQFQAVFRNSGYALATLLIRLALTAPPFYNVMIGLSSAVFAVILTLVYNKFYMQRAGA